MIVIGLIRIAGSLPVLRWAFVGALIAIVVDFSVLFWRIWLDLGGIPDYQSFDKWMDLVYMATFLIVALRWSGIVRQVAVGLFAYRMIGVVTFEFTTTRWVLLIFPNVFEFWFVGIAGFKHWAPNYEFTVKRTAIWLSVALALKMAQEWTLHGGRYLDNYTVTEVFGNIWNWLVGLF